MKCPHEGCEGEIEASTKIYLDVDDATVNVDDEVVINAFSFSHLNDHYNGHPCNFESEMYVSCTEGHEIDWTIGDKLRKTMAPQPIGDAPREYGYRGGS